MRWRTSLGVSWQERTWPRGSRAVGKATFGLLYSGALTYTVVCNTQKIAVYCMGKNYPFFLLLAPPSHPSLLSLMGLDALSKLGCSKPLLLQHLEARGELCLTCTVILVNACYSWGGAKGPWGELVQSTTSPGFAHSVAF